MQTPIFHSDNHQSLFFRLVLRTVAASCCTSYTPQSSSAQIAGSTCRLCHGESWHWLLTHPPKNMTYIDISCSHIFIHYPVFLGILIDSCDNSIPIPTILSTSPTDRAIFGPPTDRCPKCLRGPRTNPPAAVSRADFKVNRGAKEIYSSP